MERRKELLLLILILILVFFVSIWTGGGISNTNIFWNLRLPRSLLVILVGGNLAIAGAILQGYFHNFLAEPHIIGISSGAALGATIYFILAGGTWEIDPLLTPWMSLLGAFFVLIILVFWNKKFKLNSQLILLGVSLNALLSSIISFLLFWNQKVFQGIYFWILGGFNGKGWRHLEITFFYSLIAIPWAFIWRDKFNILSLSEEEAYSLGLDVRKYETYLLILISLLIAPSVATSGIIGFIGLISPHIMRLWKTSDYKWLIPSSFLAGAIILTISDIVARNIFYPSELPIGIITSFLGVPFFIYLLMRSKND